MDMQALVDGFSADWMKQRAESQMTLGEMIERLESLPGSVMVPLSSAHSYRGYYSDLALEPTDPPAAVEHLLDECKAAMGARFHGWKGGDYYMHAGVPVWVADRGSCGLKLMAINDDGSLVTAEDD